MVVKVTRAVKTGYPHTSLTAQIACENIGRAKKLQRCCYKPRTAVSLLTILVVVLIFAALVSAGVLYILFCLSPEKRWKDQVLGLRSAAQHYRKREDISLRQMREELQRQEKALSESAFHSLLERISVDKLEAFPGIGSGTTSRLRQYGYTSLAKLRGAHIQIHGLGSKRLADINHAVDKMTRDAWNSFQNDSSCAERADLDRRIQALRRESEEREFLLRARTEGLDSFLKGLQSLVETAKKVTFTGYLGLATKTVLESALLDADLPSLEDHVQEVEAKARNVWWGQPIVAEFATPTSVASAPVRMPPARPDAPVGRAIAIKETRTKSDVPVGRAVLIPEASKSSSNTRPLSKGAPAPAPRHQKAQGAQLREAAPASLSPAEKTERQHVEIMDLTIQFAFAAARTDGRVAQPEKAIIEEHIRKRYSYDQALYNRARALMAHYESAAINVEDCLRKIKERFGIPHRTALLNLAVEIAVACRGINSREQEFLDKASRALDVSLPRPLNVPQSPDTPKAEMAPKSAKKPEPIRSASDPRVLLEIEPATALTPDLIRRCFNRLWERFDPEKMAAKGGDFVKMAQSKRAAIRAAASFLIAPFGEELEPKTKTPPPRDIRENPDLDQVFGV